MKAKVLAKMFWEVKEVRRMLGKGGGLGCAVPSRQLGVLVLFRRRREHQEIARSPELQAAYFEESEQLLKRLPNNPFAARNKWP